MICRPHADFRFACGRHEVFGVAAEHDIEQIPVVVIHFDRQIFRKIENPHLQLAVSPSTREKLSIRAELDIEDARVVTGKVFRFTCGEFNNSHGTPSGRIVICTVRDVSTIRTEFHSEDPRIGLFNESFKRAIRQVEEENLSIPGSACDTVARRGDAHGFYFSRERRQDTYSPGGNVNLADGILLAFDIPACYEQGAIIQKLESVRRASETTDLAVRAVFGGKVEYLNER